MTLNASPEQLREKASSLEAQARKLRNLADRIDANAAAYAHAQTLSEKFRRAHLHTPPPLTKIHLVDWIARNINPETLEDLKYTDLFPATDPTVKHPLSERDFTWAKTQLHTAQIYDKPLGELVRGQYIQGYKEGESGKLVCPFGTSHSPS